MKVRIYVKDKITLGSCVLAPSSKVNYIQNVLKLKTGFSIFIFNEIDGEFEGKVIYEKKNILINVIKFIKPKEGVPNYKINLIFANIKNNLVADVLNSCTQIGVNEFFPITTKRTTNHHFSLSRAEKIVEEAVEQCGRICIPRINPISSFNTIISKIQQDDTIIFCDENANFSPFTSKIEIKKSVFIFIGPEGGFSDEERDILKLKNAYIISLNKFILRAETASICATFLINLLL